VPDISAGRLGAADYARNFSDIHPPLGVHEAVVESDHCYLCFDAPCTAACPTSIDIPLFIRKIGTGNIVGGMRARICPALCEEARMRNAAEDRPVRIGSPGATPPTVISPGGLRRRPLRQLPDRAAPRTGRVVSAKCANRATPIISRPSAA
jgi:hypothetical protein